MKKTTTPFLRIFILALLLIPAGLLQGQVSITAVSTPYTQNFNTYAGTAATVPTGWSVLNSTNFLGYLAASNCSNTTGGAYALGSAGNAAFGFVHSGNAQASNIGVAVSFVNNTGVTITSMDIAWDYRQYGGCNTSGMNLSGTGGLNGNSTVNSAAQDFAGTVGAAAGSSSNRSFTLTGLSIAPGATFGLSWANTDASGADNGVGVDNFSLTVYGTVPTITTGTVTGAPFYVPGCVTTGTVAFTSTGTFNAGNVYTAQLSDASGAFGSPVSIGTLSSTANSGNINITIPAGTASGTGYKIRVVSSNPSVTGSSSAAFTVNNGSAGTPGLWTGLISTDWADCRNWSNYTVPTAATNVTINQTASNSCIISGSTNAVCNNLTVSSNNGTSRDLTVQNSATLTCSGNAALTKSAGSGTINLSVLNTATFTCNDLTITGTASNSDNAKFNNEINTTNVYVNGNFTLNDGGRLDLTNSPNWGTMHVKGNYTNNGLETDFKQTNSIVYFDGTGNQTINANGFTEVFAFIVVNKPTGTLTLNTPINVENNVNFTSGKVFTTATNFINILDDATVSNMSNTSFVDGPIRKTGNDAFTFPVGDGTNYQPATISAPGNTNDHFTVQYFQTNASPMYDVSLKDPSLDHISQCEYWIIDRTGGSSNVNVTLNWDGNSCGVTNLGDLRVAHWNGTMWEDLGNGGTTGSVSAGTIITSSAVTSFSPFTISSATVENPLPVELISFTGTCESHAATLNWTTASEQNNAYFTLERSTDGLGFMEITTVPGAGNSNTAKTYTYTDAHLSLPGMYYRLSQTDYDGTRELFTPIYISCDAAPVGHSTLQMTSQNSGEVTMYLQSPEAKDMPLVLMDALGRTLYTRTIAVAGGGQQLTIDVQALAPGIYTICLMDNNQPALLRFFKP